MISSPETTAVNKIRKLNGQYAKGKLTLNEWFGSVLHALGAIPVRTPELPKRNSK